MTSEIQKIAAIEVQIDELRSEMYSWFTFADETVEEMRTNGTTDRAIAVASVKIRSIKTLVKELQF